MGDLMPMGPDGALTVTVLEPEWAMGGAGHDVPGPLGIRSDVSVALVLERVDDERTRLIDRLRVDARPRLPAWPFIYLFFEPGDFVMMRKSLLGIRQRIERAAGTA